MPAVTVLLPVFNGAEFIQDSVDSILAQTLPDMELLVIDDGSHDDTRAILARIDHPRFRTLLLAENGGAANALNQGWQQSDSDFVALMDADDIALPQRLEKQLQLMKSRPRVAACGAQMRMFGSHYNRVTLPQQDGAIKANLLAAVSNIANPTALIRRRTLDKLGLRWDPAMQGIFDWAFWCELMLHKAELANHPDELLRYRIHPQQQSRDQRPLRPLFMQTRLKLMAQLFPRLSEEQHRTAEPLLQWVNPPGMSIAALQTGLTVLEQLLRQPASALGESRAARDALILRCITRWQEALERAG